MLEENGEDKTLRHVTTKKYVLVHIGDKKALNNILRWKDNCIGHILRRIYLLHDAIEGHCGSERSTKKGTHSSLMIWKAEEDIVG